jgi:Right handed beta helix region
VENGATVMMHGGLAIFASWVDIGGQNGTWIVDTNYAMPLNEKGEKTVIGGIGAVTEATDGILHHIELRELCNNPLDFGTRWHLHNLYIHDIANSASCDTLRACGNADQCHAHYGGRNDAIFEHNRLHNIRGCGIHNRDPSSTGWIVRNNIIHDTGNCGILMYGSGHQVYNNIIYRTTGLGGIVSIRGKIYNNIVVDAGSAGIEAESGSIVRNNVVFNSAGTNICPGSIMSSPSCSGSITATHNLCGENGGCAGLSAITGQNRSAVFADPTQDDYRLRRSDTGRLPPRSEQPGDRRRDRRPVPRHRLRGPNPLLALRHRRRRTRRAC